MMHDRSNGLGGGFAAYGIYPEYREFYALHIFYEGQQAKEACEAFLERHFDVVDQQKIPTRKTPAITDPPMIWRYFVEPLHTKLSESQLDEDTFTARCVIRVNAQIEGAYIFSSGKDMGIFKAVGYPEDVGEFYRLEDYKAYCWTAHGRYPHQHPGLVGRRPPLRAFGPLGGAQWGDLLLRRQPAHHRDVRLPVLSADRYGGHHLSHRLFSAEAGPLLPGSRPGAGRPLLEHHRPDGPGGKSPPDLFAQRLRRHAGDRPFSIIVGFTGGILALNDRLKLRSMVVGEKDGTVYIASEESAIRPSPRSWIPSTPPGAGSRWSTGWKGGGEPWLLSPLRKCRAAATTISTSTASGSRWRTPAALAVRLSHRHKGIGGDGVILICPSEVADAKMRMFNLDGSEGPCAATACAAWPNMSTTGAAEGKRSCASRPRSGIKTCRIRKEDGQAALVTVDMGEAIFAPAAIPVNLPGERVVGRRVQVAGGEYAITCVSMGNPHCVVFGGDPDELDLAAIGPKFEHDPLFPQGVNTEFVQVVDPHTLKMRVWERGSGETMACGTGACASVAAAISNGYCPAGEDITVRLRGGELTIRVEGSRVWMTGEAVTVFTGTVEI